MKKAAGKDRKKDDKKKKKKTKVNQAASEQTEPSSSEEDDYESNDEPKEKVKGVNKRIRVTGRGSFVRVSAITADTPRIRGRGLASKGARKGRKVKILPDSGATMTLCHAKVAKGLSIKIAKKDKDTYELYDAQGQCMEVLGTCIIYVVLCSEDSQVLGDTFI